MKKLFLFLSISFSLQAQSDSLKVTFSEEKVEKFEKTTLIDEYEKAFGGNRVVKSGLRVITREPGYVDYKTIGIQLERKICKDISIIGGVGNVFQFGGNTNFEGNLEIRHFWGMRQKIQNGSKKPNITGNYFSLKAQFYEKNMSNIFQRFNYLSGRHQVIGGLIENEFMEKGNFTLNFGKQFGNVLNLSLQFGLKKGSFVNYNTIIKNEFPSKDIFSPFITSTNTVGWGLLFPQTKSVNVSSCDFMRCNIDVKGLFKLNLNNAFYLDRYNQNLKFDLAYERKILKSSFSINSNVFAGIKNSTVQEVAYFKDTTYIGTNGVEFFTREPILTGKKLKQPVYEFGVKEQLRYYLGMQKKVLSGKQGKNLNGTYTGIEYQEKITSTPFKSSTKNPFPSRINLRAWSGIIGYQTLTNKNSYLDVSLAIGLEGVKSTGNNILSGWLGQGHVEFSIKLGLAK